MSAMIILMVVNKFATTQKEDSSARADKDLFWILTTEHAQVTKLAIDDLLYSSI